MIRTLDARQELDRLIRETKAQNPSIGWARGEDQIKIVAPYFSGSQESLVLALGWWRDRWCLDFLSRSLPAGILTIWPDLPAVDTRASAAPSSAVPVFRIINGNATALNPASFRDGRLPVPETTVLPDGLVTQGVLSYLSGHRGLKLVKELTISNPIAILRESNTSFSRSSADYYLQYPGLNAIDLPFPMSISQLHIEQERKAKTLLPQTGFVEPKLPVRDLTRLDAIPPYDPESAATTAGQGMRMIRTVINKARVRYVEIVATDMRDVLFLNEWLHNECPNVRVFTIEPSIALLHPDEAHYLRGMVVGSTYPLDPVTQYWARTPISSGPGIIPFPTQRSQGYYNAVLAQYDRPDLMLGYHPPRIPGAKTLDRPPIWISVAGHGGRLVPVHCYTEYDETNGQEAFHLALSAVFGATAAALELPSPYPVLVRAPLAPERPPIIAVPVGIVLGSFVAVLALGAVILVLTISWFWRNGAAGLAPAEIELDGLRGSSWVWLWRGVILAGILLFALPYTLPAWEVFAPCCHASMKTLDWPNLVVVGAFTLIAEMAVVVALFLLRTRRPNRPDWPGVGLVASIGGLVAIPVLVLLRIWRSDRAKEDQRLTAHPGETPWGYAVLAAMVLTTGLVTLIWWATRAPVERFFLYVRAADPGSGLSPLVPMSLLGGAAVALGWCRLRQADLARRHRLNCPFPPEWARVVSADEELRRDLARPLRLDPRRPLRSPTLLFALALGLPFAVCLGWNWAVSLPFGEVWPWDQVLLLAFWVTAGAIVLTLSRFLSLWARLKDLLDEILLVPMVAAFERLPHEVGWLFRGSLYSQLPRYRQLTAVAWALPPKARHELAKEIGARPRLGWVLGHPEPLLGRGERADPDEIDHLDWEDRRWLADWLQRKAGQYLQELPHEWEAQPTEEALGTGRRKEELGGPGADESLAGKADTSHRPHDVIRSEPTRAEKGDYVATFVVLYLGGYFAQLWLLVRAMLIAAPLLLLATASYTFQPARPRLLTAAGLLAAVALGAAYVLYRVSTDRLVSRITRTSAGRFASGTGFLTWALPTVLSLATLAVLQLLGLFRFVVEPILDLFG